MTRALTGYRPLLLLALRRDRIKLPAWVLGLAVMTAYFGNSIKVAYPDQQDLDAIVDFMRSPAGVIMSGPGYGFEDPTHGSVLAGAYGLYLMLGAAFMNILLVARQTRAEEEAGRVELVRAAAVGHSAQLMVTVTLAVAANLVYAVLAWAMLIAQYDPASSALLVAGIAVVGLVFAGVTLVTVQLSEHSRTATGLASVAVGVAIAVRGAGDVLESHGSALSWFSPIAWSQQTRAFDDDRWSPLVLGLLLSAAAVAGAVRLQAVRDVGAGLLPPRRGSPVGAAWLGTPAGLAVRLERAGTIGWASALALLGLMYGSLTGSVDESLGDLKGGIADALGNDPQAQVEGYLGIIALTNASVACCFVIVSAHRMLKEEREGRAETVLAASVSRGAYLLSGTITAFVGGLLGLLAAGLGMGVASVVSTGDGEYFWSSVGSHLVYAPTLAVLAAVAALGFSWRPGWLNLAWVVAVYAVVGGMLGRLLDLPDAVLALGLFDHIANVPEEQQPVLPWIVLILLAGVVSAGALVSYRRRDLVTT